MGETRPPLTKMVLNNFVVKKRPVALQAKTHIINGLVRHIRRLRQRIEKDEKQRTKLEGKAERLVKEVLFLKTVPLDEMMKFALLNKKSFAAVGSNPDSKIEERALCRTVEHKAIKDAITALQEAHADWTEDLPHLIKGLGIRHREKKLKRLTKLGKLDTYLKKEQRNMKLMQELTGIDFKIDDASNITEEKKKKKKKSSGCGSSKTRKRKREEHLDDKTLKVMKKKSKVKESTIGGTEEEEEEEGDSGNGEDSDSESSESQNDDESEIEDNDASLTDRMAINNQIEDENMSESDDNDNNDNDSDENRELDAESDESDADNTHQESSIILPANNMPIEEANTSRTKTNPRTTVGQNINKKLPRGKAKTRTDEMKNAGKKTKDKKESLPVQPINFNSKQKGEVKQLDLKSMERLGKIDQLSNTEEKKTMDDDDDDDNNDEDFFEGMLKMKSKSSFFLGGTGTGGGGGDDDDDEDDDDNDNNKVDTSKYFKRNLFRKNDEGKVGRGRGGARKQRGKGGMIREEERFGGRGWEEEDEEKNEFTERKGGRGRVTFNDGRGGRRKQYGDRRGRGRFGQGRGFGRNSRNPNLMPVTSAGTETSSAAPAPTAPTNSMLHPSWTAKKKERQQSSALGAFQGKRMVFE